MAADAAPLLPSTAAPPAAAPPASALPVVSKAPQACTGPPGWTTKTALAQSNNTVGLRAMPADGRGIINTARAQAHLPWQSRPTPFAAWRWAAPLPHGCLHTASAACQRQVPTLALLLPRPGRWPALPAPRHWQQRHVAAPAPRPALRRPADVKMQGVNMSAMSIL